MEHYIGQYIKINRINQNVSAKFLASECNITPAYLSKIENDLVHPDKSIIIHICKELDIPNPYFDYCQLISNQFEKYIVSLYYNEKKSCELIFESVSKIQKEEDFIHPLTFLVEFIHKLIFTQEDVTSIINSSLKFYLFLEESEKEIFNLYYAIFLRHFNNYKLAEKQLVLLTKTTKNKMLLGLSYYHLGIIYSINGDAVSALINNVLAKTIFDNSNNYFRGLYALTHISISYLQLGKNNLFFDVSKECIEIATRMNLKDIIYINLNNIAWQYILINDFSSAIKYAKQAYSFGKNDTLCFVLAYSYFHLTNIKDACFYINEGLHLENNSSTTILLFNYINALINDDFEESLNILEELNKISTNSFERDFIYKELIIIYKHNNDYEKAFKLLENRTTI